jgi:hypothetical protein
LLIRFAALYSLVHTTATGSKSIDCALLSTLETYDDPENGFYKQYNHYEHHDICCQLLLLLQLFYCRVLLWAEKLGAGLWACLLSCYCQLELEVTITDVTVWSTCGRVRVSVIVSCDIGMDQCQ